MCMMGYKRKNFTLFVQYKGVTVWLHNNSLLLNLTLKPSLFQQLIFLLHYKQQHQTLFTV